MKTISEYMTVSPHAIGQEQTLSKAAEVMEEHGVRHLPVLHGGRLVGMLSDRDVGLIGALPDVDPKKLVVEEAMSGVPYTVAPDASLAEVANAMADHKYGSAVIMDGTKVVGVFTTVDACRALADCVK